METIRSGHRDGDDQGIQRLPPYLSLAMVGSKVLQLKRTATHAVVSRTDFPDDTNAYGSVEQIEKERIKVHVIGEAVGDPGYFFKDGPRLELT